MNSLAYGAVLILGVFISSISQVLLKKAADKKYSSVIREYLNLRVIIAYSIFVLATFMSIYAYKGLPISFGPILESTGYLFVTIWGLLFFEEKLNRRKVLALLCIIGGIVIFSI